MTKRRTASAGVIVVTCAAFFVFADCLFSSQLIGKLYSRFSWTALLGAYNSCSLEDAVDAPQLSWDTGGDAPWAGVEGSGSDGIDCAQSGPIGDGQVSWLETSFQGPGDLTFWWRVSSESDWDYLNFYVDSVLQDQISGDIDWAMMSYDISAGAHTIRWEYAKDLDCCADGSDAAWVDQVSWMPQGVLDSDGDGIPDDWESTHGLNPAVSNSPSMNSDDDPDSDFEEYIADTNPTNGASRFPLTQVTNPPLGTLVFVVDPTSTDRIYGVRWTADLMADPQLWTLAPPEQQGTGSALFFTVTNAAENRIYRTGVRLP